MIKSISLFIKYQTGYLLFLIILFVLPLGLFFQFSTYALPKVQYVFLAVLFISQSYYYSEKGFHRKIKKRVTKSLEKELKKIPSSKVIYARSISIERHRSISIALTTLCIFALMIYFQEF